MVSGIATGEGGTYQAKAVFVRHEVVLCWRYLAVSDPYCKSGINCEMTIADLNGVLLSASRQSAQFQAELDAGSDIPRICLWSGQSDVRG